ncbi:MAG TPA: putative collagen-binding domain-containing protein, partial [Clostridia bacterium]|nr:putative collagen-binding domain-containing protein [Clostridia bacterium]
PWWKLVPDVANTVATAGRGPFATNDYATTALASDSSFAISYLPTKRKLTIDLAKISGQKVAAWWFNPRTGTATSAGSFSEKRSHTFEPREEGDWVLVLDDVAAGFPPPGSEAKARTASIEPSRALIDYRAELDAFRAEYDGVRKMPDVAFFQFGMGLRSKYFFREGEHFSSPYLARGGNHVVLARY